ncbi:MAG: hypothetical protein R3F61_29810 [Myxococcota bacterium]
MKLWKLAALFLPLALACDDGTGPSTEYALCGDAAQCSQAAECPSSEPEGGDACTFTGNCHYCDGSNTTAAQGYTCDGSTFTYQGSFDCTP